MSQVLVQEGKILVADDDADVVNLLVYILEREGYEVIAAYDGAEAVRIAEDVQPDLMVLDIMMPKMDGLEVCRRIRQDAHLRDLPILVLTALSEQDDEVKGLDAGADDFIQKPIAPRLLLSHLRALLRRANREVVLPHLLIVRDLEIDRRRYAVVRRQDDEEEDEIHMPRKQFELLFFLASHPGHVFSRPELLDRVWGSNVYVVDRTIDVHVRKIREKLGRSYIETVKGVGYRFKA